MRFAAVSMPRLGQQHRDVRLTTKHHRIGEAMSPGEQAAAT
jgi:hypothetical protein